MQAIVLDGGFGLERLRLVERPVPEPGPHQVLLRMRAASLNYRDLLTVTGRYNPKQQLPLVPCSDGAGEVVAVGPGVTRVAVGELVTPIFCPTWLAGPPTRERLRATLGGPLDGTLAEQLVVHEDALVRAPAHLSAEEAACLPCAAVTAWSALIKEGQLRPGETVLVQGSGGVAIFALQLAKLAGARVIAISSSDEKLARLRALGADEVLSYRRTPAWGRAVRALAGDGVDLVVEVGGAGTLGESLRAVRVGGRVLLIGVLAGGAGELDLRPALMQQVRVQGILVGSRDDHEALCRAIGAAALRPVIDGTRVALADVGRALGRMQRGEHFGKLVVSIP